MESSGSMTTWKGITIADTKSIKMKLDHLVLFLTRTHAAILENTVSSKRETAVISRELKKEFQ